MQVYTRRKFRMRIDNVECNLHVMSLLDDPTDIVRAASVSHLWRRLVIENGLCKRLFLERFPGVTHVAYEVEGRYHIIRLADVLIGDDLEREHRIYSFLLQPQSKQMDCPRDCLFFPVGATSTRSTAEDILTNMTPVCRYPVGYSFLSSERQSGSTETRVDFLRYLESDVCSSIMSLLDDPADVVRVSAVSPFWRQLVIANGLAKKLCLKVLPQLPTISGVVIESRGASISAESESFERDHTVYASLLHAFTNSKISCEDCIHRPIIVSVANNFPVMSQNIIYSVKPGLWLVSEFNIEPFKVFFQSGKSISVKFRVGLFKARYTTHYDGRYVWTYTSPEFPMTQESVLRPIKLPEPALCAGGCVQIQFSGQEANELMQLCPFEITCVRALGRPLFPAFAVDIHKPSGEILLTYKPQFLSSIMQDRRVNRVSRSVRQQEEV